MTAVLTESGYSSMDVVRLTGCTYRQLDHWLRKGYICAATEDLKNPGSGIQRRFDARDLLVVTLAMALLKAGFEISHALNYAAEIGYHNRPVALAGGLVRIGGAE